MLNTESRNSGLEEHLPFLQTSIFPIRIQKRKNFVASLIFNYFSHRIHTIGAKGFKDIIEEGVPISTLHLPTIK